VAWAQSPSGNLLGPQVAIEGVAHGFKLNVEIPFPAILTEIRFVPRQCHHKVGTKSPCHLHTRSSFHTGSVASLARVRLLSMLMLEDPNSQISQILKKEKSFRLKEEAGTKPNVHYIGKYSARA